MLSKRDVSYCTASSLYFVCPLSQYRSSLQLKRLKESAYNTRDPGLIPGLVKIPWRREWQSTPGFLPGESHGQRSLADYIVHGVTESDTTEATNTTTTFLVYSHLPERLILREVPGKEYKGDLEYVKISFFHFTDSLPSYGTLTWKLFSLRIWKAPLHCHLSSSVITIQRSKTI